MHWGFETSNVYLLEKSHKWLRHCSIQDSHVVIALPILRLHHLGTWNNMTFWSIFCPQCFQGLMLEPYGVPTSPCPQHVGLKRFRKFRNGSVLRFVFLCVMFFTQIHFSQEASCRYHAAPAWERLQTVRWGRLHGGCFPLCHCERKSHPVPVDFQGLCFSLVLWQQQRPFLLVSPKLVKQFKLLSSIHCSTEPWSRVLLLKNHLHQHPFAYSPLLFLVFIIIFFFCLSPSSHILFSPRAVNGQVCLWFGITEFFPGVCPRAARMWDKSPYNGLAPVVCTV